MADRSGVRHAVVVLLCLATPASAQTWLEDRDLTYVLSGREVRGAYANGAPFQETYHSDGRISYSDSESTLKGKWTIQDQQVCTEYQNGPGGCFMVKMLGKNCFEYYLVTNGTPAPTWIARASQSKYPATCPAP